MYWPQFLASGLPSAGHEINIFVFSVNFDVNAAPFQRRGTIYMESIPRLRSDTLRSVSMVQSDYNINNPFSFLHCFKMSLSLKSKGVFIEWVSNYISMVTSGDVYPSYVRFGGPVHSVYSTCANFIYSNMKFKFLASFWIKKYIISLKIIELQTF